jgi:competence protein ComEC
MPRRVPAVLADAIGTTLAATIATTPIAAFHFGTVSVVSLLANVLAAPVIAIALPASVIVVLSSGLSMKLAQLLAPGAEISLTVFKHIAQSMSEVPGGHFAVGRTTVIVATIAVCVAFYARHRTVGCTAAVLIIIAAPLLPSRLQVQINMIDVGQGDALAIRSPRGRWILIDAGPRSAKWDAGKARVVPFLLQHNASRLEAIIISHPHLDHFGGVPAVLAQLSVGAIIDPVMPVEGSAFDHLVTDAQARHIKWLQARTGDSIQLDGMRLDFVGPDGITGLGADAANDFSAAFRLTYGAFSALFMVDASCKAEAMMKPEMLDVDLLKVGHHGSKTSSCAEFLERVTPSVALLSVGRINRYHHPHQDALIRLAAIGARIFRTDQAGSVTVKAGKDGRMKVSTSSW